MITRNLRTDSGRAFWAAAERASRRVATWPAWKLGQLETRIDDMATKKEVWYDKEGDERGNELDALFYDVGIEIRKADTAEDTEFCVPALTPALVAAIDALHEYAHRGEPKAAVKPPATRSNRRHYVQNLKRGDTFTYRNDHNDLVTRVFDSFEVDPIDGVTNTLFRAVDGHAILSLSEERLIDCVVLP